MALQYRFHRPEDLLDKLDRERGRVWEAVKSENEIEMCDAFLNFAVTAHSLRDWVINNTRCKTSRSRVHEICNQSTLLKACRDIANSHKHFDFTPRDTQAVIPTKTEMVDVYQNEGTRTLHVAPPRDNIDLGILLEDGQFMGLWEFLDGCVKKWRSLLPRLLPELANP